APAAALDYTPDKTHPANHEATQEHRAATPRRTNHVQQAAFVGATQDPIGQAGTQQLPEAQLDRFMFNVVVGYPSRAEELEIVQRTTGRQSAEMAPILDAATILRMQDLVRQVVVADHVFQYAVDLVRATRPREPESPRFTAE